MSRIKIDIPENFVFQCKIPVRISDINYGGHVGNDALLSIIHEARMQFLHQLGYSEMQFAGVGMIMADVAIEFKSELFYNEIVVAGVSIGEISKVGFEIFYRLSKQAGDKIILVAKARTGMICYDYQQKKITPVPEEALRKITS